MFESPRSPRNRFVGIVRKVYHPLGFEKGYNFVLFFNLVGALMGFTLARIMFLGFDSVFCGPGFSATTRALPGECYHFRPGTLDRIGIMMHLACILPATFLVCFQFVPVIRQKLILFHRINGYIVVLLSLIGTIGVFLMLRHTMGGAPSVQAASGLLSIVFIGSLALAYFNIKRLQIEQHRAWMIRAWAYAGSIITIRPILGITAEVITKSGAYYQPFSCKVVEHLVTAVGPRFRVAKLYPSCEAYMAGDDPEGWTVVRADMNDDQSPLGSAAALQIGFSTGMVIAFILHAFLAELYVSCFLGTATLYLITGLAADPLTQLHLTPAEAQRQRKISYEKQLEAGMNKPGRAGLTADRLGDAEHNQNNLHRNHDETASMESRPRPE